MPGQKRSNSSIAGGADSADVDVSKAKEVVLECVADGWPLPMYQWYKGKDPIDGATDSKLTLYLRPVAKMILDKDKNTKGADTGGELFFKEQKRFYRCARCKQVCREAPYVAYHVVCGNCKKPWIHPEIEPYDEGMEEINEAIAGIILERERLLASRALLKAMLEGEAQLDTREAVYEGADGRKHILDGADPREEIILKLRVGPRKGTQEEKDDIALFDDLCAQIREKNAALLSLQEEKLSLKGRMDHSYRFHDEGVYSCRVENKRGGGAFTIRKKTFKVVVSVNRPYVYVMPMVPEYVPRPEMPRRNWNIYTSLIGTFVRGAPKGLVSVRYSDGATYEGPYVEEQWLNDIGQVPTPI